MHLITSTHSNSSYNAKRFYQNLNGSHDRRVLHLSYCTTACKESGYKLANLKELEFRDRQGRLIYAKANQMIVAFR
jgi:hypothetical protein